MLARSSQLARMKSSVYDKNDGEQLLEESESQEV
jgi:hypothetical protein